jgi:hypothetical protein
MAGSFLIEMTSGITILVLVVFIFAIKVSYAIEKVTKPPARFPRYTNIFSTVLGLGVDRDDAATMALVRKLRLLMLLVVALFSCLGLVAMSAS